jgi:hypothetical protein
MANRLQIIDERSHDAPSDLFRTGGIAMIAKKLGCVAGALAVAGLFLIPSTARAELDFGVRGGFYDDADAGFIGGELLWGLTRQWFFNPNLEYVFVDNGDLMTLNADFHYDFPSRSPFYVWLAAATPISA